MYFEYTVYSCYFLDVCRDCPDVNTAHFADISSKEAF